MNLSGLAAPALIGFFILNIVLSVFTAIPGAIAGVELAGCENVPDWACGGPFETIAKAGGGLTFPVGNDWRPAPSEPWRHLSGC